VAQTPFPGPGQQDGEEPPLPGDPARDEAAGDPGDWGPDDDVEMARYLADLEAGREQVPEPWSSPACTVSLGEACDVDLAELAAMAGPNGLAGETFAQARPADAMRPGPVLAALAERAAEDLDQLTDDALLGLVSAARRAQARAEYLELAAVGEFTRRREAQFEAAKAAKVPRGCRDGEYADQELAFELVTTAHAAADRMDLAEHLATRLPHTLAGLAAGTIDGDRARVIWFYTRFLSGAAAAAADEILAAAAPGLRADLLARRAARLEMKLDPEGVQRRKDEARKQGRRVEARREASGNSSVSGRELDTADAMASMAFINAEATALSRAGMPGSLRELRALVFTDRTQGLNPWDRLTGAPVPDGGHGPDGDGTEHDPGKNTGPAGSGDPGTVLDGHGATQGNGSGEGRPGDDEDGPDGGGGAPDDDDEGGGSPWPPAGPGTPAGGRAPLPGLINLVVSAGTLLGWSGAAGEAGTWGLTGPQDTRDIIQAASRHPRSRWCMTITGPDGTAIAHGCARGRHPWTPEPRPGPEPGPGGRDGPAHDRGSPPGPDAGQTAQLADLLRRLGITFRPIARGSCDHKHQEDRYTPSRALKHLVRARTATCTAPGCGAQAINCDLDHTRPYPDGITCECGLGPACRRHHKCKQAPGWLLEQPEPGLMRWTTPAGRHYTTTPTIYEHDDPGL
jgi:hypothetical protein